MIVRTARVSLVLLCAVVLLACDSDNPTAPSGLTPPAAGVQPTALEVELAVAARPGARSGLVEGRPATQNRRFVVSGRVVALNGIVTELFAQLRFVTPLSGSDSESEVVMPFDDVFQGVTDLGPGTALVFDNQEVDIGLPHPAGATGSGTLRLDVTGRDTSGRVVFASAVVDVSPDDSSPVKGSCQPDDTTGCLLGDRFRATVDWQDADGGGGAGHPGEKYAGENRSWMPADDSNFMAGMENA